MGQQIMELYYHIISTDTDPQHHLCDPEFCTYVTFFVRTRCRKDKIEYKHGKHFQLPVALINNVKDIFQNLSSIELLKKVVHGRTTNSNESFNSTIWNIISKNGYANIELVS